MTRKGAIRYTVTANGWKERYLVKTIPRALLSGNTVRDLVGDVGRDQDANEPRR